GHSRTHPGRVRAHPRPHRPGTGPFDRARDPRGAGRSHRGRGRRRRAPAGCRRPRSRGIHDLSRADRRLYRDRRRPRRFRIEPRAALHASFKAATDFEGGEYPTSPMGAYALIRQALYDADWYRKAQAAWVRDPGLPRPEANEALEALQGYAQGARPVVLDAPDELYALRA